MGELTELGRHHRGAGRAQIEIRDRQSRRIVRREEIKQLELGAELDHALAKVAHPIRSPVSRQKIDVAGAIQAGCSAPLPYTALAAGWRGGPRRYSARVVSLKANSTP